MADNLRLIRRIRKERYEIFVVMFDSFQLRMLAALSGASRNMVCLPQGRLLPLSSNLLSVVLEELLLKGHWRSELCIYVPGGSPAPRAAPGRCLIRLWIKPPANC